MQYQLGDTVVDEAVPRGVRVYGPGPQRHHRKQQQHRKKRPYQRPPPPAAEGKSDIEDNSSERKRQQPPRDAAAAAALEAAFNGGEAEEDGGEFKAPVPEEAKAKQRQLVELDKHLQLGENFDWEGMLAEDTKRAEELADERGLVIGSPERERFLNADRKWCLACEARGASEQEDPYADMNAYVGQNYNPLTLDKLVTIMQNMYIDEHLPLLGAQSTLNRFWYRRTIFEHLQFHHKTTHVRCMNEIQQAETVERMLHLEVLKYDDMTAAPRVDTKVFTALKVAQDHLKHLRAESERLGKMPRKYFG